MRRPKGRAVLLGRKGGKAYAGTVEFSAHVSDSRRRGGVRHFLCVVFIVRSWRAGVAMGIDKAKLRRAVTSSATFTVLPAVSILLGVIARSAAAWAFRCRGCALSVVGALHYEGNAADIAARAASMAGGLGSTALTAQTFVTIGFVMTAGILSGCISCVFCLKGYMKKRLQKPRPPHKAARRSGRKKAQLRRRDVHGRVHRPCQHLYRFYLARRSAPGIFLPLAVAFCGGALPWRCLNILPA